MKPNPILYAVLRLNKKVEYEDPITNKTVQIELGNCAGYIPVFYSKKDAKKASQNGKYEIVPISEVVDYYYNIDDDSCDGINEFLNKEK